MGFGGVGICGPRGCGFWHLRSFETRDWSFVGGGLGVLEASWRILAMARTELNVTVMGAEDLKKRNKLRRNSVYAVVWIDPAMKRSTRILHRAGRNPIWNDEIIFSLGDNVLIYPHSTLTIEVSGCMSHAEF